MNHVFVRDCGKLVSPANGQVTVNGIVHGSIAIHTPVTLDLELLQIPLESARHMEIGLEEQP